MSMTCIIAICNSMNLNNKRYANEKINHQHEIWTCKMFITPHNCCFIEFWGKTKKFNHGLKVEFFYKKTHSIKC